MIDSDDISKNKKSTERVCFEETKVLTHYSISRNDKNELIYGIALNLI